MNMHILDCLVTGYEPLIPSLNLPDPNDRHVLAAAIRCNADVIVTFNLKDFPEDVLAPMGIEAQHPDDFITHQLASSWNLVCHAAKQQRQSLKNPPLSVEAYLAALKRQGLVHTTTKLREYTELI